MLYNVENGGILNINCDPQPNPDVSGIGVRIAVYLQALFSIFLCLREISMADVILTNISKHRPNKSSRGVVILEYRSKPCS